MSGVSLRSDAVLWRTEDARLWPALSRPTVRTPPPKGADRFGERVRGMIARRARRVRLAEAERIVEQSAVIGELSERALTDRIDEVRCRVRVRRDDRATVHEAFAVARTAIEREVGLSLYPEQVAGALALARGCCAEMATGEGKTITAVLPAALDGWLGRGVHVLTVNDYLARRDARITDPAYRRLGLSVGVIEDKTDSAGRREAYLRDVTYMADKQAIFDFLRDRLAAPLAPRLAAQVLQRVTDSGWDPERVRRADWSERIVQRGLHAAIVDEADSILIDDAITPAIIGQDTGRGEGTAGEHFRVASELAREFRQGEHYRVDLRLRRVFLTNAGKERLGELAESLPPFWAGPRRREELVVQAITARELYHVDDEYVIKDGRVVIVDRSTGRLLEGRQWQLGVHQAVEAKEGLEISLDRQTTARCSYQRFFQRYRRLAGMTGTAWEVRHELWRDYHLPVVRIATHEPMIREHAPDHVFRRERDKYQAVASRTQELHAVGRPVLVGTWSVESSERLGALLAERGVPCRILNALREEEEAAIVAEAGRVGAVTVATNMAGRGTDIFLEEGARRLGGLVVLATERHDEARVDRQLAGRAGRQGDPGRAEAYVSLEDSLIRRHGLRPLAWLCRRTSGPVRRSCARVLWSLAQHSAAQKAVTLRAEAAKADAWLEMALHHETR